MTASAPLSQAGNTEPDRLMRDIPDGTRVSYEGKQFIVGTTALGKLLLRHDARLPTGSEAIYARSDHFRREAVRILGESKDDIEALPAGSLLFAKHDFFIQPDGTCTQHSNFGGVPVPRGFHKLQREGGKTLLFVPGRREKNGDIRRKEFTVASAKGFLTSARADENAAVKEMEANEFFGWKLHLHFDALDPVVVAKVDRVLLQLEKEKLIRSNKIEPNDQLGKEATVYVGHREIAKIVAQRLVRELRDVLKPHTPECESWENDISFVDSPTGPLIMGRFNAIGDGNLHQYGLRGLPFFKDDMNQFLKNRPTPDQAWKNADFYLRDVHGEFYAGIKN